MGGIYSQHGRFDRIAHPVVVEEIVLVVDRDACRAHAFAQPGSEAKIARMRHNDSAYARTVRATLSRASRCACALSPRSEFHCWRAVSACSPIPVTSSA